MLVFLSLGLEPLFAAPRMEEVATSWDAHNSNAINKSIHANDAVLAIELIHILSIGQIFKRSNELFDVLLLHLMQLSLQLLIILLR